MFIQSLIDFNKMCTLRPLYNPPTPSYSFSSVLSYFCVECYALTMGVICSPYIAVFYPPPPPTETHNLPKQPPLAQAVGQAAQCLSIMAHSGSGSCAFAAVDDYLH